MKQLIMNTTKTDLEMMRFLYAILLSAIFVIPGCAAGVMCLISLTKLKIVATLLYSVVTVVCFILTCAVFVLKVALDD